MLFAEKTADRLNTDGFLAAGTRDAYTATTAVVSCSSEETDILVAWNGLYHSWLPVSMYCYAGADSTEFSRQYFEEYLYKSGKTYPYRLKLYLPVEKKTGFIRLSLAPYQAKFLTRTETGPHAERRASEQIIHHLTTRYPYSLIRPFELLRISDGYTYTCGMRISHPLLLEDDGFKPAGINALCAILEVEEACDPKELQALLERWMWENHMIKKQEPFLLYTIEDGHTKTKLLCPINSV